MPDLVLCTGVLVVLRKPRALLLRKVGIPTSAAQKGEFALVGFSAPNILIGWSSVPSCLS